jgi:hypothetical protein
MQKYSFNALMWSQKENKPDSSWERKTKNVIILEDGPAWAFALRRLKWFSMWAESHIKKSSAEIGPIKENQISIVENGISVFGFNLERGLMK